MRHVNRFVAAAAALSLAACGGGPAGETTTTTSVPEPTSSTEPTSTTTGVTTTTVPASTTTTTPATTSSTLAGEPVDLGPVEGDVLGVVGVAHDDVLNVRSGPGVEYPVVGELAPTADHVVAIGETRHIPGAFWIRVEGAGAEGWVNLTYVAYLGDTDDITARVIADLGETPEVETMLELGTLVAESVAAVDEEPEVEPRIVMSVAPAVGDLGEVTFDVIGAGDDSVSGSRLHVFGTPSASGEGFILKSVEVTVLCGRGVTDGVCI